MNLRGTESKSEGHVTVLKRPAELHHLKPALFQSYPKIVRLILGWMVMILFTLAFLQPALLLILPIPFMWRGKMFYLTSSYLGMSVISLLMPEREVPWIRQVGQLLYEIIDLRTNLNKDDFEDIVAYGEKHRLCTCMHPHGIVP